MFIHFDFNNSNEIGSLVELPVKPSAIYFGMNCNAKDMDDIASIIDEKVTRLYKLEMQNNKYFELNSIK